MNFGLDPYGNPVTEPLDSVCQVLQWTRLIFSCNSPIEALDSLSSQSTNRPQKPKILKSPGPQQLVCHDMCGGYLDDRFSQGCDYSSPYIFYHWPLIDTFIYFSHHFVTIPPIGWIKAAHKHGVTVLGTVITEWDKGAAICKEILDSPETVNQVTTKLADMAVFYGFDGWLINIENVIMPNHITMLQSFVKQLTEKCHARLDDCKVLWYDSVINTGELKWQDELNTSNEMFFHVCDGIFLNYNITEEKLVSSRELASASNRQFDVYAGIDVFGRSTPGGGGFNCKEDLKMIFDIGLSCALFAPGWVFEHLGPENFVGNEIMFWGILRDLLKPRPPKVPFTTSFCQGYGEHYFINGQVISDKPWFNLALQQLQPSFTQSQFESYRVIKIFEEDKKTKEEKDENEKKQKFRVEAQRFEPHPACPRMEFDVTDCYLGGGCLKISAKKMDSQPVLFRLFKLTTNTSSGLKVSITRKIPQDSPCKFGIIISKAADKTSNGTFIVWTEKTLDQPQKSSVERLLNEARDITVENRELVTFETCTALTQNHFALKHGWKTSVFNIDKTQLARDEEIQQQDLLLYMVLIPSVISNTEENRDEQMCLRIGHLKVQHDPEQRDTQEDVIVENINCLEVKSISQLTLEDREKMAMNRCFIHESEPQLDQPEKPSSEDFLKIKRVKRDDTHFVVSSEQEAKPSGSIEKISTNSLTQKFSLNTLDLNSPVGVSSVESKGSLSTLHCLKWNVNSSKDIDHFMIFCQEQSGVKTFIGHAATNCFVWKEKEENGKIPAFFWVVPVRLMSQTNLPLQELGFDD